MARPPRAPLLRRLFLLGALAASCSYYLLVLQAQASVPPRYDGFAYGAAAAAAWKDAVLAEAFLDPLCPDSRDAWQPLKLAVNRYSPRVSLIVHPFPLPYHNNAFRACRALYIANKFNSSSTYPLLELFFKNQDNFSNSATSSLSSTAVTGEMSKMAAQAVGNSVSEFQSGFSDVRTDLAARVSFKYGCTRAVAGPMGWARGATPEGLGRKGAQTQEPRGQRPAQGGKEAIVASFFPRSKRRGATEVRPSDARRETATCNRETEIASSRRPTARLRSTTAATRQGSTSTPFLPSCESWF